MYYQRLINQIDPTVNAKACEGFMRLEFDTLDALSRKQFEKSIKQFKAVDKSEHAELEKYA